MAESAQQLDDVRAVFHRNKESLIGTYRAEGAGIGKDGDEYVIVVYVSSRRRRRAEPLSVEGVRVIFEMTGRFNAF